MFLYKLLGNWGTRPALFDLSPRTEKLAYKGTLSSTCSKGPCGLELLQNKGTLPERHSHHFCEEFLPLAAFSFILTAIFKPVVLLWRFSILQMV